MAKFCVKFGIHAPKPCLYFYNYVQLQILTKKVKEVTLKTSVKMVANLYF